MNQEESISQTASKQGMMQESQTLKRMEAVLLKNCGSELEKITDVATTLLARDYKGLGNQTGNGVIEWQQD